MRPFRSLIIAIALAVGSLGLYRWVQPPAVDPASSASGLTAPSAGPAVASAFGRSLAVSAHVAAKRTAVSGEDPVQGAQPGRVSTHRFLVRWRDALAGLTSADLVPVAA
jgi:hypothetical protein